MPDKKQKTHIAIVLDRSGSMEGTKENTVKGYNEQVEQIQQDAKDQDILVSLVTFNGHVYEHFWNDSADKLNKASHEDYSPSGSTALYDAVGYAIDKLQKTTTEDENTAYLMIVITDGEENASQQYKDVNSMKNRIESLQKDKNWTFSFMGCGDGIFKLAKTVAVPLNNCATWANDRQVAADFAMKQNKMKLGGYLSKRKAGKVKTANFYVPEDAGCSADMAMYDDDRSLQQFASGDANVDIFYSSTSTSHSPSISSGSSSINYSSPSYDWDECKKGVFATTNKQVNLGTYYTV